MKPLPKTPNLQESVWKLVQQIPFGEVTTFGSIAKSLGDVSASRFVGKLMLHHDHQPHCLCHRIVRADGSIGKFVAGIEQKVQLLRQEGHVVKSRVPTSTNEKPSSDFIIAHGKRWADFHSHAPLTVLADFQRSLATSALIKPIQTVGSSTRASDGSSAAVRIAGVDVSFAPKSDLAVAAYTEVSLADRKSVYTKTYQSRVEFPYISGYLAFRELPLLMALLEQVRAERDLADVLVVDGSGVLHPRQAGIAMMLGVLCDVPTIGVTKKHLCGKVDLQGLDDTSFREITVNGETMGFAMLPGSGTSKPIYVSPGHRCDPVSALGIIQQCRLGRRLPEPIYWADRLSRAEAKQTSV